VVPAPDLIKIDVEGAEYLVLEGARLLLSQQKPMLFIALHGAEQKRRSQKALERLDYQIFDLDGSALNTPVLQDDEIYAMPKLASLLKNPSTPLPGLLQGLINSAIAVFWS